MPLCINRSIDGLTYRSIHASIYFGMQFWYRGRQCLTGFHLWQDCCQDYRIRSQKKLRPNFMRLLEYLTITCLLQGHFNSLEYVMKAQGSFWRITLPLSKWYAFGWNYIQSKSWKMSLKGLPQASKKKKKNWTVFLIKLCRIVYLSVKCSREYLQMNVNIFTYMLM